MLYAALLALLNLAWLAYASGLSGGFLFDDYVNLDALGATGPVDNWQAFWRYVTSGTADPTGRPLALLSFLLDARDWPADPASFLRHNVMLHLGNGVLLFVLLRRLGQALSGASTGNDFTALLAAGLWLLHPLLVSTTLYAVQREAMLPATFTLLGLLAYAQGREAFAATQGRTGVGWMTAGIGLGTLLAMGCKANGILLPLLAWVLETTVWRIGREPTNSRAQLKLRRLKWLLLILPSLLLFAYVGSHLRLLDAHLSSRSWTLGQRVLTEPRVLMDYLQLLVVPRSLSTGLYNDGYSVSEGWLQPVSTLPAMLLIASLLFAALAWRARFPRLSAALLFFFAGQLLESTLIPLELYFEHRNYLPAMLLFWPLAHSLASWSVNKQIRIGLAAALLTLFAFTTFQRTSLWGRPDQLAALWARQNPDSARAQATAALAMMNAGQYRAAAERLGPLWRDKPTELQLALNYVNAVCHWRGLSAPEKQALTAVLASAANGQLMIHQWLGRSIDAAALHQCPGMELSDVEAWIVASAGNPGISTPDVRDQTIEPLLARVALARRQPRQALQHFDRALVAYVTPDAAARNASYLASAGYYAEALAHLNRYEALRGQRPQQATGMPWLHLKVLEWQGYWPREMAALRAKLAIEIAAHPGSVP